MKFECKFWAIISSNESEGELEMLNNQEMKNEISKYFTFVNPLYLCLFH